MLVQTSVYNRSCLTMQRAQLLQCNGLKAKWGQLLVLIALIVPLLGMKPKDNKQEATSVFYDDVLQLQEEATGSATAVEASTEVPSGLLESKENKKGKRPKSYHDSAVKELLRSKPQSGSLSNLNEGAEKATPMTMTVVEFPSDLTESMTQSSDQSSQSKGARRRSILIPKAQSFNGNDKVKPPSPPKDMPMKRSSSLFPSFRKSFKSKSSKKSSPLPMSPLAREAAAQASASSIEMEPTFENLKTLVYPAEDESVQDKLLRQAQITKFFQKKGFTNKIDRKEWRLVVVDLLDKGYFSTVAFLMYQKDLFLSGKSDFAYIHTAMEKLSKKLDVTEGDILAMNMIVYNSDCKEWDNSKKSKFKDQIQKSRDHLNDLKSWYPQYEAALNNLEREFKLRSFCGM